MQSEICSCKLNHDEITCPNLSVALLAVKVTQLKLQV